MNLFHYRIEKVPEHTLSHSLIQTFLVITTLLWALCISLNYTKYGLLINALAQFFWLYNTYKIWKHDRTEWWMFVLSIVMAIIVGYWVINYWFL